MSATSSCSPTFDPTVARYEEQPVRIEYVDAASRRRPYTPDVPVYYHDDFAASADTHLLLCEAKYREDLFANWKEYKPKIRAGRAHARRQGWHFVIITEREVRRRTLGRRFEEGPLRQPLTKQLAVLPQNILLTPINNHYRLSVASTNQRFAQGPRSLCQL